MVRLKRRPRHVTVIGAGMAGTSAADTLEAAGVSVTILEREDRGGGRACSALEPGVPTFTADRGAQFILSHYRRVRQLIDRAGLRGEVIKLGNNSAIVREGNLRRITGDPTSIYRQGLLGSTDTTPTLTMMNPFSYLCPPLGLMWGAMEKGARLYLAPEAKAGRMIVRAFEESSAQVAHLPPDDLAAWSQFDHDSSDRWLHRHYGTEGTNYLAQPLLDGLFFQQPEDFSEAIFLWMVRNLAAGDEWFVMQRGTQSIVDGVLKTLQDVRLGTEVRSIEHNSNGSGSITVRTNRGALETDAVIIAVPPPVARNFLAKPTPMQQELMNVDYAPTIVVNLRTARRWAQMPQLAGVHIVMIPRVERRYDDCVAAFSIESGKHKGIGNQELLGVHTTAGAAKRMMLWSDQAIVSRVVSEIEPYLPGLETALNASRVERWSHAIPRCHVGKTRLLSRLWREQQDAGSPVLFAGDGTTFPTLEAAAWSGQKAAKILIGS